MSRNEGETISLINVITLRSNIVYGITSLACESRASYYIN